MRNHFHKTPGRVVVFDAAEVSSTAPRKFLSGEITSYSVQVSPGGVVRHTLEILEASVGPPRPSGGGEEAEGTHWTRRVSEQARGLVEYSRVLPENLLALVPRKEFPEGFLENGGEPKWVSGIKFRGETHSRQVPVLVTSLVSELVVVDAGSGALAKALSSSSKAWELRGISPSLYRVSSRRFSQDKPWTFNSAPHYLEELGNSGFRLAPAAVEDPGPGEWGAWSDAETLEK